MAFREALARLAYEKEMAHAWAGVSLHEPAIPTEAAVPELETTNE